MRHFLHLHISVINELLKGFADDLVKFSLDSSAVALFFLSHQLFSSDEPGIYQLTLTYKFNKIVCNQFEQNFFFKRAAWKENHLMVENLSREHDLEPPPSCRKSNASRGAC